MAAEEGHKKHVTVCVDMFIDHLISSLHKRPIILSETFSCGTVHHALVDSVHILYFRGLAFRSWPRDELFLLKLPF